MKAKEFISTLNKSVTHIDITGEKIFNIVIDNIGFGLVIDTKGIPAGTTLTRTDNFTIENDILTSGSMSVNLAETDMLGMTTEEVKEN